MLCNEEPKKEKLSVPCYGRTIWSTVEKWTEPLIEAYNQMAVIAHKEELDRIAKAYNNIFCPIMGNTEKSPTKEQTLKLATSAMLSIWMLSQYANKKNTPKTFRDAEDWFLGKHGSDHYLRLTEACDNWSNDWIYETLSSITLSLIHI